MFQSWEKKTQSEWYSSDEERATPKVFLYRKKFQFAIDHDPCTKNQSIALVTAGILIIAPNRVNRR